MYREFRDFIMKGNVLDLAVGVIMAVAFGAVILAFTDGVLMPLIAALFGKPDFNALAFNLNGTPIQYGRVLTAIVNLILVGGSLFLILKVVNRRKAAPPAKAPAPETDHDVLVQIRDALRTSTRPT
jgi:large conductance mechanosensitive channel